MMTIADKLWVMTMMVHNRNRVLNFASRWSQVF
jgi:hypothetical protein